MFLHIGLIHIATNMWCLWSIGPLAERVFGRWIYLLLYFYTGVSASLLSLLAHPLVPSAGASGAIFGVAGALIPAFYFGRLPIPPQAVKATLRSLVIFAIINLAIGAKVPGIDNAGHIGGLALGLLAGALLSRSLTAAPEAKRAAALAIFALLGLALFYGEHGLRRVAGFVVPYYNAQIALEKHDTTRALADLSAVVAQQPRLADAQFLLGSTLLERAQRFGYLETELIRLRPDRNVVFRTLAWSPNALHQFMRLGNAILNRSGLDPRLRELAILTVGRVTEAGYEYDHHVAIARRVGVTEQQIDLAVQRVGDRVMAALQTAAQRIRAFHEHARRKSWLDHTPTGGALGQLIRPLERVAVYAPGSRAPYPSSVLMAAVPARVAEVKEVVLASPPGGRR